MKTLLLSAAAVAAVAAALPALAQTPTPAPAPAPQAAPHMRVMMMQPMTRDAMVQKVQQHFAKLDANRDGFVTKAEADAAKEGRRERIEQRVEKRREGMFERLDTNNDGSISRSEFDSAHQAMAGGMGQRRHVRLRMMHAGMGGKIFETADADKDGRVSIQEATAAAAAHFDKADTNHDGTLTPDEMRAGHRMMRGTPGQS